MSDSSIQGSGGSGPGGPFPGSAPGASGTGDNVRRQAQAAKESAKQQATEAKHGLKVYGNEVLDAARERARGFADEQKRSGAEQVDCVARAIDKAAEELSGNAPQLEPYARSAASTVGSLAETLRQRSVEELGEQISDLARRQPLTLFFGAAAVGFVAARFLRTSGSAAQNAAGGAAQAGAAPAAAADPDMAAAAAAAATPDFAGPGEPAGAAMPDTEAVQPSEPLGPTGRILP